MPEVVARFMRGTSAVRTAAVEPWPGRILCLPGVYRPQADSSLLAAAMRREGIGPGMDVLDLCTGSGVLALQAARLGAQVTAVDISRRAVMSARLNASLAGLPVSVRRGDLFAAVPERRFDVLVSNPPYVAAPDPSLPRWGARRAWDAGCDGRALLDRICDSAPAALRLGSHESARCDHVRAAVAIRALPPGRSPGRHVTAQAWGHGWCRQRRKRDT